MNIIVIGLNHKSAPVDVREKVALAGKDLSALKESIERFKEILEWASLFTCNRTEIYLVAEDKNLVKQKLYKFFTIWSKDEIFSKYLYFYTNEETVKHIFAVASGIDSQVLGENQILGQVKDALHQAQEIKTSKNILNKLFNNAIFTGKRARTETAIGEKSLSIGYAAVELATKIFETLNKKKVLLLGAGKMGQLVCKHLADAGAQQIIVANRTYDNAVELAKVFGGQALSFADLDQGLMDADVVVGSTGAPHFVLTKENVKSAMKKRPNKPLFLVDIAVPRDIDPQVNDLNNVFLYNIDDLNQVVEEYYEERKKEIAKVEKIIAEECEKFLIWKNTLQTVPLIKDISDSLEDLRSQEWEKIKNKLSSLSNNDQETIEIMTKAIIGKVLANPIKTLKEISCNNNNENLDILEIIRKCFIYEEINESNKEKERGES